MSIGGDVVNVCTFGTEKTKGAVRRAARGLQIDDDVVSYITSMIPNNRGFDWSLHDCYYGNGSDRKPIKAFIEQMDQYPVLWKTAQALEGLITHLGVHASGVVCLNKPMEDFCSYMSTSQGQLVTSFNLDDLELVGGVKYDFLTVSGLDRIHQCLNYMLEDHQIEWQGNLRSTYNKYLLPENLIYDDPKMWDMCDEGKISSLFQFDTDQGSRGIKEVKPRSLQDLAVTNAMMRLMSDGGELPLDKFARFRENPYLWYEEMNNYGLTEDEQHLLEKYLKQGCGLAEAQEVIMQLSMDPHISNFTMAEANKLRKVVAKKKFKDIAKVHDLFMKKGKAAGTSDKMLNYVWDYQISLSLGYSFSRVHTTAYSLIALQEMNLAYRWPIIYWNTACMSVDTSALDDRDFEGLADEGIVEIDDSEDKKASNSIDYSKMASAINRFSKICKIELPDINKSKLGFTPNVDDNSILYGLKGVNSITDPTIKVIMDNRPFRSFDDFLNKCVGHDVNKTKVINLIKSKAFDKLEDVSSADILKTYLMTTAGLKTRVTMQNAQSLIKLGLIPSEYKKQVDCYMLTKELRKHRDSDKIWYIGDNLNIPNSSFNDWSSLIKESGIQGEDVALSDGITHRVLDSTKWDKFYNSTMVPLKEYIKNNSKKVLDQLNEALFKKEWNKYCSPDPLMWELDSLNFFFTDHPLRKVIPQIQEKEQIPISHLADIAEGIQDGVFNIKGKVIPRMKLFTIAGTVLDKNKIKSTVTLQTPDGVVVMKVYKNLYATMVNVYSHLDEDGEKIIDQNSFFEKGTHLLVTGIKRGDNFIPKVYKRTGRKSIEKINLDDKGNYVGLEVKRGEEAA